MIFDIAEMLEISGAGGENRTPVVGLGSQCSATELHPREISEPVYYTQPITSVNQFFTSCKL